MVTGIKTGCFIHVENGTSGRITESPKEDEDVKVSSCSTQVVDFELSLHEVDGVVSADVLGTFDGVLESAPVFFFRFALWGPDS